MGYWNGEYEVVTVPGDSLPWLIWRLEDDKRSVDTMIVVMTEAAKKEFPPSTVYELRAGIPENLGRRRLWAVVPVSVPLGRTGSGYVPEKGYWIIGAGQL